MVKKTKERPSAYTTTPAAIDADDATLVRQNGKAKGKRIVSTVRTFEGPVKVSRAELMRLLDAAREEYVASGGPPMSWDDIDRMMDEMRERSGRG